MRERSGRVIEARPLAKRVTLISIACEKPTEITARPGQFVSLRLADGSRRSYSIVSTGGEATSFDIVLKAASPTGGTADLVRALAVGTEVSFFGPMGYFLFDRPASGAVLFGATGVGISALMPMLSEALDSPASSVELFWGLREESDFFFRDQFEALSEDPRFSLRMFYSSNGDGYMTKPLIERAFEAAEPHIYLCGHGNMIADVRRELGAKLPAARLHTEVFYPVATPVISPS